MYTHLFHSSSIRGTVSIWLCAALVAAMPAAGSEGVTEVNAAAAVAGGISPGDAPGLPVTLSQAGSYRLTGNLAVSGPGDGIVVTANDVTIDLNGFSLSCAPFLGLLCTSGNGISANGVSGTRVVNGTVRAFGGSGLLLGEEARVESVRAVANGAGGIAASSHSTVLHSQAESNGGIGIYSYRASVIRDCTASENGSYGIFASMGSTVIGNTAIDNGDDGLVVELGSTVAHNSAYSNDGDGFDLGLDSGVNFVAGGLAVGNTAVGNGGLGLRLETTWGQQENVLNANNGGNANPQLSGGIALGPSVCGGALCPP